MRGRITKPPVLKLAVDARMLGHSGIGTQIENVLKLLINESLVELRLIGDERVIASCLPQFNGAIIPFQESIYGLKEQYRFPEQQGFLHYFPHYNAPVKLLKNSVVMVHDLIHLDSDEFQSPAYQFYARTLLSQISKKALSVLTVSEYSKSRYIHYFPTVRNRIEVIYNGLDHSIFKPAIKRNIKELSQQFNLPDQFYLCVGIGKKHKNLDLVIKALAPLWSDGDQWPLVIAGSGGMIPDYVQKLVTALKVRPSIISLPFLEIQQLVTLYSSATWLLMPSRLEGFGFPVIESMACGTPVACATAASLPEIAEENALYFDPKVPEDLTNLTERLKQKKVIQRFTKLGLNHSKNFSWEKNVTNLLESLLKVIR